MCQPLNPSKLSGEPSKAGLKKATGRSPDSSRNRE